MSTHTSSQYEPAWDRVHEAITQRWPQIRRGELLRCQNDVNDLVNYVSERVSTSREEVESVVQEFAPGYAESLFDSVGEQVRRQAEHAGDSLRNVYRETEQCISDRPAESVLTSFVAGIIVGATVTALFIRTHHQPTRLERLTNGYWR